jgi:hypothetical protein
VVTLKHFDAQTVEDSDGWDRHNVSANVSKYMLADTYFPAFELSIKGGAKGVMCAYNAVNMTPVCLSPLMRAARKQWGFEANGGYVTSDSDSVADAYQRHHYVKTAAEASCLAITKGGDQIDSGGTYERGLLDGVKQGLCTMSDVDAALRVVMQMRIELGLFDPVEGQQMLTYGADDIASEEAGALNLVATQRSLVLLKNGGRSNSGEGGSTPTTNAHNEQSVLPLTLGASTAVIGPHYNASWVLIQPDSGDVCPSGGVDCIPTPIGMIKRFNHNGTTVGSLGSFLLADINEARKKALRDEAVALASKADQVVLTLGIRSGGYGLFSCARKRRPGHEQPVCTACNCSAGAMQPWKDVHGPYGDATAVRCSTGACEHLPGGHEPGDEHVEAETHDRLSIDLPALQHELAHAVIALGKPTVIVLLNGGSVALSETELQAPNVAVIEAFYPGTRGAEAIAGAIFATPLPPASSAASAGERQFIERWGRLPYSVYPASWVNETAMDEMDLAVYPGRTFRYAQTPLQFSFGHGLQMAELSLQLVTAPKALTTEAAPIVTQQVAHSSSSSGSSGGSSSGSSGSYMYELLLKSSATSRYASEAVVVAFQVPVKLSHPHPLKAQMVGFQRVVEPLEPGGSAKLTFNFSAADLSIVDTSNGDRIVEPGEYKLVFSFGEHAKAANTTLRISGPRRVLQAFPIVEGG